MDHLYSEHEKHYVATDVIIFGFDTEKLRLLLIKRNFEPEKGKWSLMGGFLKKDEDLDHAAGRVLNDLTGMEGIYLEQLAAYGDINRDSAGRVISISYYALINSDKFDDSYSSEFRAKWFSIDEVPELIFDHNIMVEKALKRLRRRCRSQPVGLELLPEKFTLPQLLKLYEAIYQQEFDKRNFRKKILSFGVLRKLEEKDHESSKKGAFLYKFEKEKYERMLESGGQFGI
ncbi:MAG: NUDIX hydrolase [Bacteroidales bacterium]